MDFSTVERALRSLPRRQPPLPTEVIDLSQRILDVVETSNGGNAGNDGSVGNSGDGGNGGLAENAEYCRSILRLIELGSSPGIPSSAGSGESGESKQTEGKVRWEPLAVGLRLAVDYLEQRKGELPLIPNPTQSSRTSSDKGDNSEIWFDDEEDEGTGLGTGGGGVYAEGPRVPKRVPKAAGETTNDTNASKDSPPNQTNPPNPPNADSPVFDLLTALPQIVNANVEHSEPRVRSLIAQAVGAYALYSTSLLNWWNWLSSTSSTHAANTSLSQSILQAQNGRSQIHSAILASLHSHLEMKEPSREDGPSAASDGALDDTTGWRALETNLHALASYIDGCVGWGGGNGVVGSDDGDGSDGSVSGSYLDEESLLFETSHDGDTSHQWFLAGLQHCCVVHVNRHVRAASAAVLGVLVKSCMRSGMGSSSHWNLLVDQDSHFRSVLKESLRSTLADNWSQVRMAGSVLCRRFVRALLRIYSSAHGGNGANNVDNVNNADNDEEEEEEWTIFECAADDLIPMLLPRMCLNRFYIAQGVKLYSQETWKMVFGGRGSKLATSTQPTSSPPSPLANPSDEGLHSSEETRGGGGLGAVARNAAPLCRYYSKMCDADNHAVREAACQGIAELAQKVGKHPLYAEYLAPHVTILLQALLMCFYDESWPVRDEACLACGTFCISYAEECRPELPTLFERWTEQLTDQIWSVREDAAVALGDAITAYGLELWEKVLTVVRKGLPAAREQPPMSREEYKQLQNDAAAHTGNQLYSCGSLAPKLRKGGAGRIGCGSCAITRPKAPWEATDGSIYVIRELCVRFSNRDTSERQDVVLDDNVLLPLMTELADVCRLSHYPQSDDLRTTLWRQLPIMAQALGKRRFKGLYLELFIDLLAKNMDDRYSSASQLSVHAAGQCAEELAKLIGVGIFRGRLAETGRADVFDRIMQERKRDQRMHAEAGKFVGMGTFSPFGPPVAG